LTERRRARCRGHAGALPPLLVDEAFLNACRPRDRALLGAVLREPVGRIESWTPEAAFEVLLKVGRLWPRARTLLAQPTRLAARRYWRNLEQRLNERVGLSMSASSGGGTLARRRLLECPLEGVEGVGHPAPAVGQAGVRYEGAPDVVAYAVRPRVLIRP
jgi:hypothetical protein